VPATSTFLSLPTGMHELVEALEPALLASGRVTIRRRAVVRAVVRDEAGGGRVLLADGAALEADAVVVATPAHVAATLVAGADAELGRALDGIEYSSTATISLAFATADVPRKLDATGYVVPRAEHRPVMACTWNSTKFLGRAPAGSALFRLFFGGAHRPELFARSDDELLAMARAELREVLGVTAEPRFTRVARWERGMPQYHRGHRERVARIEELVETRHPWLALAGNAFHGVGIPDCIRSGEAAAARALAGALRLRQAPAEPAAVAAACAA
jgi:oxygen-dependent protoporphyrinogen oxidase